MGWNPFKRRDPEPQLQGAALLDAVLRGAKDGYVGPVRERWSDVVEIAVARARSELASPDFGAAGRFTQAFGIALAAAVPIHVADIVTAMREPDPSVEEHSELVFQVWNNADEAHVHDLASMIAWRHALASFGDVDTIFQNDAARENARQHLMTICGNLFEPSDRAQELMRDYQLNLDGGYLKLGGGMLAEGGTYWIHRENPLITTHAWMVNRALDGPPLDVHVIDPAGVFYIQTLLSEYLIAITRVYRDTAMRYIKS